MDDNPWYFWTLVVGMSISAMLVWIEVVNRIREVIRQSEKDNG